MTDIVSSDLDYRAEELEGLFEPDVNRSVSDYLARLWAMRHYMMAEARGSIASSTSDYFLGRAWLVLEPILTVSVYFVLFGLAIRGGDRIPGYDFLSYLVIGRGVFTLFSRSIQQSAMTMNRTAATSAFDFPQMSRPLGKVLNAALRYRFEFAATILVLVVKGTEFRLTWLLVPFMSLTTVYLATGVGLIAARMAARVPDVRNVLSTVLRLLYYASGVMIPVESFFPSAGWLQLFTLLNPAFALVKLHHWAYLGFDLAPISTAALSALVWTAVILPIGVVWFIRGERSYQAAIVVPRKPA